MEWPTVHPEPFAALLLTRLGWTPAHLDRAFTALGSFAAILDADLAIWPPTLTAQRAAWCSGRLDAELIAIEDELAACERAGVALLVRGGPDYPALLENTVRPPTFLFVRGDVNILSLPQLAMVGSRRATRGGLDHARAFAADLAGAGFCITSGLALGIDTAAHRAALEIGGCTVAVMGTGWDLTYPRSNRDLVEAIVTEGGAVVTEFPAGIAPLRENFPRRNRIISGLSCGVLVVEAALKSGSLITARHALEQGREVFAIPGSIHNPQARGCHQLIREGALLVEESRQIVEQLGSLLDFHQQQLPGFEEAAAGLTERQQSILDMAGYDPVSFDCLLEATGLSAGDLAAELTSLELLGRLEQTGGLVIRLRD